METIVLGYDATESARRALDRTAELARALGARVVVATVEEPPAGPSEPVVAPAMPAAPATTPPAGLAPVAGAPAPDPHRDPASLGEQARALLVDRGIETEVVPVSGDAADEIVAVAASRGATLVVVGTRDPGLVSRLLGHSVSDRVVRAAPCDVLVVR